VEQPPFAKAWLRQRDAGDVAVASVEAAELRALSPAKALEWADALLSAAPIADASRARRDSSGLVEQQRLFARGRGGR